MQYELVKRLSALHQHIFVVGDADQSIYKWRGADFRNIRRFEKRSPVHDKFCWSKITARRSSFSMLPKRSSSATVTACTKGTVYERRGGERLVIHEAYNESDEGQYVVDSIAMLTAQGANRAMWR